MALPEAQVWDPETEMKSTTLTAWEKQGAGPTLDLPIHTCVPPLLVPWRAPRPPSTGPGPSLRTVETLVRDTAVHLR